jgi:hypothetical protein
VGPRASVWTLWKRENILPLPEIEPRLLGRPAPTLFSIPTSNLNESQLNPSTIKAGSRGSVVG